MSKITMSKKQKLQISWPAGKFTIADLQNQHPKARQITLRFRVNKALAKNELTRAGQTTDGRIGRPVIFFARSSASAIAAAAVLPQSGQGASIPPA